MSYYRIKFIPTYTQNVTDAYGQVTGTETLQHKKRDGSPVIRSVVVFGLDKVARVLANDAERVSVKRLLMKRDETTAEEIAAGVEQARQAQLTRDIEAQRQRLVALEATLASRAAANNANGGIQQSIL